MKELKDYFKKMRFSKTNHIGLGDIRLTMAQQDELVEMVAKKFHKPLVMPSLWARFPKGVYAVDTKWNIKYHPTDVGIVMKAKDCRYIETDLKLIIEFILAHNEA